MRISIFKSVLPLCFVASGIGGCSGQSSDLDQNPVSSSVRASERAGDSLFVVRLLDEAWELHVVDPDSCILVSRQALSLAQQQNFPDFAAEAYCRIGNSEEAKWNLDTALQNYFLAYSYDSASGNIHEIARDRYHVAMVLKKQGKHAEALRYSFLALAAWEKMPERKTNVANVCVSIGNIYHREGKCDSALQFFYRSLDTARAINNVGLMADAYNSIGLVYESQKSYDQAMDMYNDAMAIDVQRNNQKGIAAAYNNIGNIYYYRDQLTEALESYMQSAALKEKTGLTQGLAGTYNNIGLIYESLGRLPEAIEYHEKSLAMGKSAGDVQGVITSENNIGVILLKQKQPAAAIAIFEAALSLAKESDAPFAQLEILKNLSDAHAENHDFRTAFEYTRLYQVESDSIEAHAKKATQIDIAYKEERAQRELLEKEKEKQEAENERQRTMLYSLIIFIGLMTLLLFAYLKNKRNRLNAEREEQQNKQKIEDLVKSQELNAFRMMLETQERERNRIARDLHDRLGAKLSTAKLYYGLMGKKIQDSAQPDELEKYQSGNAMLDEACDEVRKVAHDLVSGELMKFGLVKALQNLSGTIEAASSLKIDFHAYGMDDRLNGAAEHSLYQIIQELLANIMRHAQAGEVTIQMNRYNHTLNILVEDDGVGFNPDAISRNSGLGLQSIRDRVRQLNGTLQIDSSPGRGTIISIDLSV